MPLAHFNIDANVSIFLTISKNNPLPKTKSCPDPFAKLAQYSMKY